MALTWREIGIFNSKTCPHEKKRFPVIEKSFFFGLPEAKLHSSLVGSVKHLNASAGRMGVVFKNYVKFSCFSTDSCSLKNRRGNPSGFPFKGDPKPTAFTTYGQIISFHNNCLLLWWFDCHYFAVLRPSSGFAFDRHYDISLTPKEMLQGNYLFMTSENINF